MSRELDSAGILQNRVLRSPSHESVTTDLSLLSLSSCGSDMSRVSTLRCSVLRVRGQDEEIRGTSPIHVLKGSRNSLLQVPGAELFSGRRAISEVLFEEENEVIRSCGALSNALGLRKSFSSSDIVQTGTEVDPDSLRTVASESEMYLGTNKSNDMSTSRLDYASRSCSTWVAVGDVSSTSQLPSPQGPPPGGVTPSITAADFVRSVNKKVRHSYIQRRLMATYRALQRLAQSELSIDKVSELGSLGKVSKAQVSRELLRMLRKDCGDSSVPVNSNLTLTVRDVEREKGKPLTKYERNMMIFNWLHTLEDSNFDMLA